MTNASTLSAEQTYQRRQARNEHPDGSFDRAGRWYPSESEYRSCCDAIRLPSRAFPYSYMLHCRTRKHCQQLAAGQPVAA